MLEVKSSNENWGCKIGGSAEGGEAMDPEAYTEGSLMPLKMKQAFPKYIEKHISSKTALDTVVIVLRTSTCTMVKHRYVFDPKNAAAQVWTSVTQPTLTTNEEMNTSKISKEDALTTHLAFTSRCMST